MKTKLLIAAGLLSIAFLCLWTVLPILMPWSPVNCWRYDVDITCGRCRYQRYLLWIRIVDRVEETELSGLYRELVGEPPPPVWREVSLASPMKRWSPRFAHKGSLRAGDALAAALRLGSFTDEAKRAAIVNFFDVLQKDDSHARALGYASVVSDRVTEQIQKDAGPIDVDQLPKIEDLGTERAAPPPSP